MFPELHEQDLTAEQFERFRDFIQRHSGISLEDGKRESLGLSLVTRAVRWGCSGLDEYLEVLGRSDDEFNELLNLITINETSFFRFPAQFEALAGAVLTRILAGKPSASSGFRVWSAGCATGEEPYSIAMTLADSELESMGYRVQVLGTDVSTRALDIARRGEYPAKALAGVDAAVLERHFEPTETGYAVKPVLREAVEFSYHNLVKEPYPLALMGNWDVIFCRNVTIYFSREHTRRVVSNLFESLNPGGFLFIGHSETLTAVSDCFEPVEIDGLFLHRKPDERRLFVTGTAARSGARAPERSSDDGRGAVSRAPRPGLRSGTSEPFRPAASPARPQDRQTGEGVDVAAALAEAHQRLSDGDPLAALRLAQRVLGVEPRNIEAFLISAYAHADGGDFTSAMEECRRVLAISPLVPAARYILGIIYLRLEEPVRAIEEFKRTLYIDPDFVLARFNLANLYRSRGLADEARREYENTLRSLERNPEGAWSGFMGGFTPDLLVRTCERSLAECRRTVASG